MERVAELNFPRLKTAATMRSLLTISRVVAAVFNRGQLKSSSAIPSGIILLQKVTTGARRPRPIFF